MPTFVTESRKDITDFIIPMETDYTEEICDLAVSRMTLTSEGRADAAIYWTTKHGVQVKTRVVIRTSATDERIYYYVYLGEYHPRIDGKADKIYRN